jgi:gamma-glutamyl-gamma-aminobutyrate hydrolase PuuD
MSLICRPVVPEDESLVSKWLEQDEVHKANGIKWQDVTAPGTYAEIVMDEDGIILTVIRYHAAIRVAMQFNPDATYRVAKHSHEIVDMLKQRARGIGAKEVIIRPGGKAVRFADKLGFVEFTGSKIVGV